MNFTGTIFQKDGKTPMRDAFIEIWQVNEKVNTTTRRMISCAGEL